MHACPALLGITQVRSTRRCVQPVPSAHSLSPRLWAYVGTWLGCTANLLTTVLLRRLPSKSLCTRSLMSGLASSAARISSTSRPSKYISRHQLCFPVPGLPAAVRQREESCKPLPSSQESSLLAVFIISIHPSPAAVPRVPPPALHTPPACGLPRQAAYTPHQSL